MNTVPLPASLIEGVIGMVLQGVFVLFSGRIKWVISPLPQHLGQDREREA